VKERLSPTAEVGTVATVGAAVATLLVGLLTRLNLEPTDAEQGALTVLAVAAASALSHRRRR
jgi:hypothetical protein